MSSTLTTLTNLKTWLGTPNATDDALLTRLISAASAFIESWLNRTISIQTYNEKYDGTGQDTLMLSNYPIVSLSSISIYGVAQTLLNPGDFTSTGFSITNDQTQLYGQNITFDRGRQNVAVSYSAGYATVPLDIEQACLELCALKYKNLRGDRIGLVSKGLAGEATTFFVGDMPQSVKTLLQQYKNVVPQ